MKKILVVGANGYIGSCLVTHLCNQSNFFKVIASGRRNNNIDKRAIYKSYDIYKQDDSIASLMDYFECPDILVYLAWQDGFDHNSQNHLKYLFHHWNFIREMIDGGIKHIMVAGSFREYGSHNGMASESLVVQPDNFYTLTKLMLRKSIELYIENRDICFQWIRPFTVFGNEELNNSILSKLLKWDKEGKETFSCTYGNEQYDYINVEDVSEQIINIVSQTEISGIINCCSGIPKSLKEMVLEFIQKNNLRIQPEFGVYEKRKYDPDIIYGDRTKYNMILHNLNR